MPSDGETTLFSRSTTTGRSDRLEIPKFRWFNFRGPTPTAKLSENKARAKISENTVRRVCNPKVLKIGQNSPQKNFGDSFFSRIRYGRVAFLPTHICEVTS